MAFHRRALAIVAALVLVGVAVAASTGSAHTTVRPVITGLKIRAARQIRPSPSWAGI
jgi:hypothetical protein